MKSKLILLFLVVSLGTLTAQPSNLIAKHPKVTYDWKPGFVSITELTGATGLGLTDYEFSKQYYGITTFAGYQFTRNIRTGAGAGIHMHNDGPLFPLYLDIRANLNSQVVVPFVAGSGGVMIDFTDFGDTRVFINPALGIRYVAAPRKTVTLQTGLMVSTGGSNERSSFINFKIGIELKPR